jgi:hypothetical protein
MFNTGGLLFSLAKAIFQNEMKEKKLCGSNISIMGHG